MKTEKRRQPDMKTDITTLTADDFDKRENGTPILGLRWKIRTPGVGDGEWVEDHECYQYDDLPALIKQVQEMQAIPGYEHLAILTHRGQYRRLRVVWKWDYTGPKRIYQYHE
jgi:hypothetical protein